jgi:hypothetical protein
MARKSGWQQFADNFSSTYDAVNDFGRAGAARDIMDQEVEEQFDASGASTGFSMGGKNYGTMDDIRTAKYQGLSDNAARYGDIAGSLDMQAKIADIRGKGLSNKYDFESMQTRLDQLEATRKKTEASTGLTDAQTGGVVEDTKFKQEVNPIKVEQAQATVDKTVADTGQTFANTELIDEKTKTERLNAKQKQIDVQTAQMTWNQNKPLNDALLEHQNTKWGSPEEAKKALIEVFGLHGDQEGKGAAMVKTMDAAQIAGILKDANVNSAEIQAMLADPKSGIQGVASWLSDNDGVEGNEVRRFTLEDGSVVLANSFTHENGDTVPMEPYYVQGANEAELRANVQAFATPGGALQLANQMATFKKNKAGLGKIKAETNKLNAEAKTGGRDYEGDLNVKSMNEFTSDPDGTYAKLVRAATASGLKVDWDKVAEAEIAHQQLLNRARGNNSSNTGLGGGNNKPVENNGGFSTPRVKK